MINDYTKRGFDNQEYLTLQKDKLAILNLVYPIGSIYMSVNNVNPSTLFGGTWERYSQGRVLVGVDESETEFNKVNAEGGEKSVTLTSSQSGVPAHKHENTITVSNSAKDALKHNHGATSTAGNHTHSVTIPSYKHKHSVSLSGNVAATTATSAGTHSHGLQFAGATGQLKSFVGLEGYGQTSPLDRLTDSYRFVAFSNNATHTDLGLSIADSGAHTHSVSATTVSVSGDTGEYNYTPGDTTSKNNSSYTITTTTTEKDLVHGHESNITNKDNAAKDAAVSHNNLQPYITCYIWKRTA